MAHAGAQMACMTTAQNADDGASQTVWPGHSKCPVRVQDTHRHIAHKMHCFQVVSSILQCILRSCRRLLLMVVMLMRWSLCAYPPCSWT